MFYTVTDHKLDQAEQIPSPNCDLRPSSATLDLIVIHNISLPPGQFGNGYIENFFCNQLNCDSHPYFESLRQMRVSSHLLINRDGKVIQFVAFNQRAWHAGQSCYQGRQACNDFSIGIELEGTDTDPYEMVQYSSLVAVTQALISTYPTLSIDAIVGHCDIAPERKTDPGEAFDWQQYRQQLQSKQT